jgi:hypothetical protein
MKCTLSPFFSVNVCGNGNAKGATGASGGGVERSTAAADVVDESSAATTARDNTLRVIAHLQRPAGPCS